MQQTQQNPTPKLKPKFSWLWLIFWAWIEPAFAIIYLLIKFADAKDDERRLKK